MPSAIYPHIHHHPQPQSSYIPRVPQCLSPRPNWGKRKDGRVRPPYTVKSVNEWSLSPSGESWDVNIYLFLVGNASAFGEFLFLSENISVVEGFFSHIRCWRLQVENPKVLPARNNIISYGQDHSLTFSTMYEIKNRWLSLKKPPPRQTKPVFYLPQSDVPAGLRLVEPWYGNERSPCTWVSMFYICIVYCVLCIVYSVFCIQYSVLL